MPETDDRGIVPPLTKEQIEEWGATLHEHLVQPPPAAASPASNDYRGECEAGEAKTLQEFCNGLERACNSYRQKMKDYTARIAELERLIEQQAAPAPAPAPASDLNNGGFSSAEEKAAWDAVSDEVSPDCHVHSTKCMREASRKMGHADLHSTAVFESDAVNWLAFNGKLVIEGSDSEGWSVECDPPDGDDAVCSGGHSLTEALCGAIHALAPPASDLPQPPAWQWPAWLLMPWLFMEEDGRWFATTVEPHICGAGWSTNGEGWNNRMDNGDFAFTPPPVTDWRESKMRNPSSRSPQRRG